MYVVIKKVKCKNNKYTLMAIFGRYVCFDIDIICSILSIDYKRYWEIIKTDIALEKKFNIKEINL